MTSPRTHRISADMTLSRRSTLICSSQPCTQRVPMVNKIHCVCSFVSSTGCSSGSSRRACRRQRPGKAAAAAAASPGANTSKEPINIVAPGSSGSVLTYGERRWQLCKQMVSHRNFYWRMMLTFALIVASRVAGEQLAAACPHRHSIQSF
jgi:hypothetical protein